MPNGLMGKVDGLRLRPVVGVGLRSDWALAPGPHVEHPRLPDLGLHIAGVYVHHVHRHVVVVRHLRITNLRYKYTSDTD